MATEQLIRVSHIKIERRFTPTPLLQAQLDGKYGDFERIRREQGGPAATQPSGGLTFFRLPDRHLEDKYIDVHGRMLKRGIAMRKRTSSVMRTADFPIVNDGEPSSEWEAKLLIDHDGTYLHILEADGLESFKDILDMYAPDLKLQQFRFTDRVDTLRKFYVVQKPFGWHREANEAGEIRVVLDEILAGDEATPPGAGGSLHYQVGKVVVAVEVAAGTSDDEHDVVRRAKVAETHAWLDEFIKRHLASFPGPGVKGKLEMYSDWREKRKGSGALV